MSRPSDTRAFGAAQRLLSLATVGLLALRLVLGIAAGLPAQAPTDHQAHAAHQAVPNAGTANHHPDTGGHADHGVCHFCRSPDAALPPPSSTTAIRRLAPIAAAWPGSGIFAARPPEFRTTIQARAPPSTFLA